MIIHSVALASFIVLLSCGGTDSSGTSSNDPVISDDNASIDSGDAGAKLDTNTELQTGFQGLVLANVFIVYENDKRVHGSEVALGTKFSIVFEGVKKYTLKNGKAFPGLSLQVSGLEQPMIISEDDLLASYMEGLTEEEASTLRATVTVGEPMKPGEYLCAVHVVDKNNSDAYILSTWNFQVK